MSASWKRDQQLRVAAFVKDRLLQLARHMKSHSEDFVEYAKVVKELNWEQEDPVLMEHLRTALQQPGRKVVLQGDVLSYCPSYDVRNADELLRRLKEFHEEGLGGMRRDHLQEAYVNADNDVDRLEREGLVYVVRRKRQPLVEVVYYREAGLDVPMLKDVQEKWRTISVEGKHDKDLEEALVKGGLQPMQVEAVEEDLKRKKRKRKQADRGTTARAVGRLLAETDPAFAKSRGGGGGGGGDDYGGGGGGGED